jgi:hypothetical protein
MEFFDDDVFRCVSRARVDNANRCSASCRLASVHLTLLRVECARRRSQTRPLAPNADSVRQTFSVCCALQARTVDLEIFKRSRRVARYLQIIPGAGGGYLSAQWPSVAQTDIDSAGHSDPSLGHFDAAVDLSGNRRSEETSLTRPLRGSKQAQDTVDARPRLSGGSSHGWTSVLRRRGHCRAQSISNSLELRLPRRTVSNIALTGASQNS